MKNSNLYVDNLLQDAFDALREDVKKISVLSDVSNRGELAVFISGSCAKTKKTEEYGRHTYDPDRSPKHVVTIFRSSRKNMLRAMIHELIHVWQYEVKPTWVAYQDSRHPVTIGDESYVSNAAEREARSYEALAYAFLRKENRNRSGFTGAISMIRESINEAEELIVGRKTLKASAMMSKISKDITKYELLEGELTLRQTAKIVEYRARYQEDIMLLADAKTMKKSKRR